MKLIQMFSKQNFRLFQSIVVFCNLLNYKSIIRYIEGGTVVEDAQYSSEPDWLFYANFTAPRIQIGCLLATSFAHVIPATHMAALQINNGSQNVLANYSLVPLIRNTGSDLTNGGQKNHILNDN